MSRPKMPERPDLLLVNTPLKPKGAPGGLYPSLASLTLGSYLSRKGLVVRLLDPTVDLKEISQDPARSIEAAASRIGEIRPKVLGLTTMGHTEGSFAIALAREVRSRMSDLPILLGGSWATGYADLILERFDFIDAIALGSAEHPLRIAVERGLDRASPSEAAEILGATPGWMTRAPDGSPVVSGTAPPPEPKDSPPLDLSLLNCTYPYDTMVYLTSRGCPYRCAFCTEPFMFHGQMHEPLGKIERDLRAFDEELDVGYLWICDPLFGASRARLDALLPLLERCQVNFLFESRVDTLAPEDLPRIRQSGGDLVYLGLEAASVRSLLRIGKVPSPRSAKRYLDRARAVVDACAAADVVPVIGVLNPVPGDEPEDLTETLRFLEELDRIAAAAAEGATTPVRPFFYAFPYRVDRGTEAARTWNQDARVYGCTANVPAEELFVEREVQDASTTVDRAAAAVFRQKVRGLNQGGPEIMSRVVRSMPRPFLIENWMATDGDG